MPFEDKSQQYLESGYALGRGYASSLRLNYQHTLLRELLGYIIHPEILSHGRLPQDAKVADIGTGTGYLRTTASRLTMYQADFTCSQWLIDVSRELPSAQLDGFDVSEEQYPSGAWLPSQISLRQLDITKSIPPNLEGSYDLVHVQLFLCVVQKDGPAAILKELYKLLKPGGYLQWVEYDPISFTVVSPDPSLKQSANQKHVQIIQGPAGKATEWPSKLPSYLADTGFQQVTFDSYPLPPRTYAPFMQCHLVAAEEVSFKAMKNDGPEAQGPMFRDMLAEVYKECQTGVTMAESPVVVIGKKPI
ncbi:hypothetical protein MMC16_005515 [Acarospora aff. strigata]|nr:hypothetical protein [Acarospora aff. strigata]